MSYWDTFLYYGKGDLEDETIYDIYEILLQPKRSLYYYRKGSAGIDEYENNPNSLSIQVFLRFDIASTIAYRNSIVSNGENGLVDRRIGVSQNFISFISKNGDLDINILYFLYSNYEEPKSSNFLLKK